MTSPWAPRYIFITMGKRLNRVARQAVEAATPSTRVLAEQAGLHSVTVHRWRTGAVGVGPGSALKLARVIKRRALKLLELASRLEAVAEQEGGDSE